MDKERLFRAQHLSIDTIYIPCNVKPHSKQTIREKLGKIIEQNSNKRNLFLSPTRGLII